MRASCLPDLPCDVGLAHADEVLRRVVCGLVGLLGAEEVGVLVGAVALVEAAMPEVDVREAEGGHELADDQGGEQRRAQGDGEVGASHGSGRAGVKSSGLRRRPRGHRANL
jgi:hypothetical protein